METTQEFHSYFFKRAKESFAQEDFDNVISFYFDNILEDVASSSVININALSYKVYCAFRPKKPLPEEQGVLKDTYPFPEIFFLLMNYNDKLSLVKQNHEHLHCFLDLCEKDAEAMKKLRHFRFAWENWRTALMMENVFGRFVNTYENHVEKRFFEQQSNAIADDIEEKFQRILQCFDCAKV